MVDFVPGIELCREFYRVAVRPVLHRHHPTLRHAAALLGPGSEVLGFDDSVSTDHNWGPRVQIFLDGPDLDSTGASLEAAMARELDHRVEVLSAAGFLREYLGLESVQDMDEIDWLSLPQHKLLSIAEGTIYHDGIDLTAVQRALAWYPDKVWRVVMAAAWKRVAQEEHLVGRAGSVGDDVGSRLIAARIVRDLMRLCFYMERRYPPYPKWFGSGFRRLQCASDALPSFERILQADDWRERDAALADAYRRVATLHNALGLTAPIDPEPRRFHERPFLVSDGERFAHALMDGAPDALKTRFETAPFGNIDLLSDNTDVLERASVRSSIAALLG